MTQKNDIYIKIKKIIFNIIIPILFIIAFLVFAGLGNSYVNNVKCQSITINILNEKKYGFLNKDDILKILTYANGKPFINQFIKETNLYFLEKTLLNNTFVDKAELYFDIKGNIFVEVELKEPVARIMSIYKENYYIDENGVKFNTSEKFTPQVLVISGHTYSTSQYKNYDKKLFELASYIKNDDFLSSLIGQVYVKIDKEIILIPRIGNYEILFGPIEELPAKFKKVKIFYDKIIPSEGWNVGKTIDLRFKNQIIIN